MKPSLSFARMLLVASTTTVLFSGCYTQLVTREDEEEPYERGGVARIEDEQDSTAERERSYYDCDDYDNWQRHYRIGFSYYYPSWWYWDAAFSDPYYYGWPGYYTFWYSSGFGWNYYGYSPYYYGGYWGHATPYGHYPYGYYTGYPYVVTDRFYQQQTRNSGYRRTGDTRMSGFSGRPATSVGAVPASRRAGVSAPSAPAPATRRSESPSGRGSSRSYAPQSSGRSGGSATPSRSGSSGVGSSQPSGGSRSPEGGTRNSGSTRNRGGSDGSMSGYFRSYIGTQTSGSEAVAPASRYYRPSNAGSSYSSPSSGYSRSDAGSRSYTPSYSAPASSPSPSYAPAPSSSAPSSGGGGDGGNRSSGASRSGRN